jgi:nitrogen regulatory protein P-II 1
MKKIEAIIRHFKLEDVKNAVNAQGIAGMTITEVRGFGRQKGRSALYRGAEYVVDFVPKVQLTILAHDDRVSRIVAAIVEAARTGTIGDGKIYVTPVDEVVRIRTGERGHKAI